MCHRVSETESKSLIWRQIVPYKTLWKFQWDFLKITFKHYAISFFEYAYLYCLTICHWTINIKYEYKKYPCFGRWKKYFFQFSFLLSHMARLKRPSLQPNGDVESSGPAWKIELRKKVIFAHAQERIEWFWPLLHFLSKYIIQQCWFRERGSAGRVLLRFCTQKVGKS